MRALMTHHYRAIVIGGGVAGTGCMHQLAQLGLTDGLLIDQGGLASGSSGRSAAFVETQYLEDDRIRMCAFSLQLYQQLARENGLRFAQIGKLLLGFTSEDLAAFERSVSFQRSIGLDGAVVIGPEAVGEKSSVLRTDDIAGALWGSFDGYIDAAQLCRIYVAEAEARGWTVGVSTQVRTIEVGIRSSVHARDRSWNLLVRHPDQRERCLGSRGRRPRWARNSHCRVPTARSRIRDRSPGWIARSRSSLFPRASKRHDPLLPSRRARPDPRRHPFRGPQRRSRR